MGFVMAKADVLKKVKEVCLVPVVRASSAQRSIELARAIAAGGVTVMEMTMTVPDPLVAIRTLVKENPELLIGAGTVLDAEMANACIQEGAQFIVSPATNFDTIAMCQKHGVAALPGALTPTEVLAAWNGGADVVKIFPASAMGGATYIKSLKAPLPQVEMIPTGGVSVATVGDFLNAGCFALGVGADLANEKAIAAGKPEEVTEQARKYAAAIAAWRATR